MFKKVDFSTTLKDGINKFSSLVIGYKELLLITYLLISSNRVHFPSLKNYIQKTFLAGFSNKKLNKYNSIN